MKADTWHMQYMASAIYGTCTATCSGACALACANTYVAGRNYVSMRSSLTACYLQCLQSLVDSITLDHTAPLSASPVQCYWRRTAAYMHPQPAHVRAVLARAWKHDVYTSPDVCACVYLYVHVACVCCQADKALLLAGEHPAC